jgi:hypothetical protein
MWDGMEKRSGVVIENGTSMHRIVIPIMSSARFAECFPYCSKEILTQKYTLSNAMHFSRAPLP